MAGAPVGCTAYFTFLAQAPSASSTAANSNQAVKGVFFMIDFPFQMAPMDHVPVCSKGHAKRVAGGAAPAHV
jgi:hypothetical protein